MHVRSIRAALVAVLVSVVSASAAEAQAYAYPSFQLPRVTPREFNFGVADADNFGTSLLFQWREGYGPRSQLSLDIGFADSEPEEAFFVGGQYAHQLITANAQTPFDVLFTGGLNLAFSDNVNILRIPFGASLGRAIPLEGQLSLTPFVHPKVAIARVSVDNPNGEDNSNTEFGFEVDLGVDFGFSPNFGLRLAGGFGSDEVRDDTFGISLAWRPAALGRRATPAPAPRTRR